MVSAAFAQERDVAVAVSLIGRTASGEVRYVRREIIDERGDLQMVILEATFLDPNDAERGATCMLGAHGVRIAPATTDLGIAEAS